MSDLPPSPPPGLNYIAAIEPSLNFILILTPLGATMVPLILTLFVFSSPQVRRHPVFILNILACCFGIFEAVLNGVLETRLIIYPLDPTPKNLLTVALALAVIPPLFIDSILVFRLLAFYPVRTTPTKKLIRIFALPVLFKCGRFSMIVMFLHSFTITSGHAPKVQLAAELAWGNERPYLLTEFGLQTLDSLYSSSIFLYNLHQYRRDMTITRTSKDSHIVRRIRDIFLIAVENFIFPVITNLIAIGLFASGSSFTTASYFTLVDDYTSILGVVFATVWTSRRNWIHHGSTDGHSSFDPSGSTAAMSAMRFAHATFLDAPHSNRETIEQPVSDGPSQCILEIQEEKITDLTSENSDDNDFSISASC